MLSHHLIILWLHDSTLLPSPSGVDILADRCAFQTGGQE